jgi:NRPS condensation-like uncharacterized protein
MMWKQHHSWCDGASVISFILACTDNYDPSALIHIKPIAWWQRLFLRASVPFNMLKLLFFFIFNRVQTNLLHDGRRALSGTKVVATSRMYSLVDIKTASRRLGSTINDMVTACLASGMKQYFESHGSKGTEQLQMVIPANIRFKHYENVKELRLENMIGIVPLTIPLHSDIAVSLREIRKATDKIRTAFGTVYASYIISKSTVGILPYFLTSWYLDFCILPFTFAFSNTPGILKPVTNFGQKHLYMTSYIQCASRCGLSISCLSYVDKVQLTCVADDTIMKDP